MAPQEIKKPKSPKGGKTPGKSAKSPGKGKSDKSGSKKSDGDKKAKKGDSKKNVKGEGEKKAPTKKPSNPMKKQNSKKGKPGAPGKPPPGSGRPPPGGKKYAPKGAGAPKGKKKKRGEDDGGGRKKNNFWLHLYHKFIHAENVVIKNQETAESVEALGLTQKHLKKLKLQFEEIDLDGSGSIDSEEFFEILEENRSPFTDALFALIDLDGSGTIEFEEYIMVCVTYCMYTRKDILKFVFDVFDKDGSGTIDEKEFITLCNTVNNAAPLFPGNFAEAITQFDTNDDGLIDFNEFMELDKRYPLVLFPAFRLQDRMMKKTLGEKSWVKVHENIEKERKIREYMEAHGGQRPPDSIFKKGMKKICGCFFSKEREIKMDAIAKSQERAKEQMRRNENAKKAMGTAA